MNIDVQPVTVAIADVDRDRRAGYERLLQDEFGITLLADIESRNDVGKEHAFAERRVNPRADISGGENEVARIKRLKPLVILVNLNLCTDEDYELLLSLRRVCPESNMILITNDLIHENQIMQFLEIGARGYLTYKNVQFQLSKATRIVGQGEAWVPRRMLGNIMERMLH